MLEENTSHTRDEIIRMLPHILRLPHLVLSNFNFISTELFSK